jgi:DNA topoisomerase-1
MPPDDPRAFAAAAGLRYTESERDPAIWRRRWGRGFTYVTDAGERLARRHPRRREIEALALPPAWTDVWITPFSDGHLQSTGYDDAGRKQYRYHERWSQARRRWHDAHLLAFGRCLPALRAHVDDTLGGAGRPTYDVVHAAAVRLLDHAAPRVGNLASAQRFGTRGLTTLTTEHAELTRRRVRLSFLGKGRIEREVAVHDPQLSRLLRAAQSHDDEHLFSWREGGEEGHVTGASLNAYLRDHGCDEVHAHLFRSWHATVGALQALATLPEGGSVVSALQPVAERLGHTVATCRGHYVHHRLEALHGSGGLAVLPDTVVDGLDPWEARLLTLLAEGPLHTELPVAAK